MQVGKYQTKTDLKLFKNYYYLLIYIEKLCLYNCYKKPQKSENRKQSFECRKSGIREKNSMNIFLELD